MFIALLVAFATSSPLLPPPWQAGQIDVNGEYAIYGRPEPDGSTSILSAGKQVCSGCQPDDALAGPLKDLDKSSSVRITYDTQSICEADARHVVETGLATADKSTQNVDMYVFRKGPAIYILLYRFRYAEPKPDEVQALSALCPPAGS